MPNAEVEVAAAEVPSVEAEVAEAPSAEAATVEPPLLASIGTPLVVEAVPLLATTAPIEPPLVAPHHPSGIVFRSVSVLSLIILSLFLDFLN